MPPAGAPFLFSTIIEKTFLFQFEKREIGRAYRIFLVKKGLPPEFFTPRERPLVLSCYYEYFGSVPIWWLLLLSFDRMR
jgi:hypothetical protein